MSYKTAEAIAKSITTKEQREAMFPFVLLYLVKQAEKDSSLWKTDPVLVAAFGPHTNVEDATSRRES